MINALVVEENMSNLTTASGEVSASSGSMYTQQSTFASTNEAQQPPRKRSLPGNPDPDAEVIALSPRSLLATNRFICEICNKGFKRDQNLQLHRRGHNLPWKLKQRANKVERKKVYVCPEPTCVHHDPSRALGDLTGIKKHFSRKHGEKKWKCEKCSKRYAVQSDWKAHFKICGTREYRCECGKIFSRRDSFITHRAFCDVLAEENARAITANPLLISSHSQQPNPAASQMPNLPPQLQSHCLQAISVKRERDQLNVFNPRQDNNSSVPPWLACSPQGIVAGSDSPHIYLSSPLFSGSSLEQSLVLHENPSRNPNSTTLDPFMPHSSSPHMSATALLQKAAQMGVTMSKSSPLPSAMLGPHQAHMSENTGSTSTAGSGLGLSLREDLPSGFVPDLSSFGNKADVTFGYMEPFAAALSAAVAPPLLHDMMSSLSSASGFDSSSSFDEALNGMLLNPKKYNNFQESALSRTRYSQLGKNDHENRGINGAPSSNIAGGSDGLTRDFLGLKAFPNRDFVNITGFDSINNPPPSSSKLGLGQRNQNQRSWYG